MTLDQFAAREIANLGDVDEWIRRHPDHPDIAAVRAARTTMWLAARTLRLIEDDPGCLA